MLVLSRKLRESIIIAGQIEVTVLEVRGKQVRLGIKAPAEMPIERPDAAKKAA